MASSPEEQAMHQLQSQQLKLLDKIDELRTIGVGGLVDLPQLIVCGNQSSGKSSVLEAISRVRFPMKDTVCTRFATEVVLRRSPEPIIRVSIEPGSLGGDRPALEEFREFESGEFLDTKDLSTLMTKAQECMGLDPQRSIGFSDDVLKIEISGPDKPELTLVDLPGLYHSTSGDQGREGRSLVRGITEKYMQNPRSIILAVITAKTDYHLQEVLDIAEQYDPKRERTLGIITHPDTLPSGSGEEKIYLQFVQNEKIKLRLGWHALRNRQFETRGINDKERDEKEKEFFETASWRSVSRECVGIDSLRRRLSNILLKHIHHNLPGLVADIQSKITDRKEKLAKLGASRATPQQQRGFLLGISSEFERITRDALNGMYRDEFFGGLDAVSADTPDFRRLRAVMRELNENFAVAMEVRGCRRLLDPPFDVKSLMQQESHNPYLVDWVPEYVDRHTLEEEMCEKARTNRGLEFPGSANQQLVGTLFRDQSQPWEELGRQHLTNAWEAAKYFVCLTLQHLTDEHTYVSLVSTVISAELDKMKTALLEKLAELTAHTKHGHPLPVGKSFITKIQQSRATRHVAALQKSLGVPLPHFGSQNKFEKSLSAADLEQAASSLQLSSNQFAAAEVIDQMQAYYDTAILTFVDNVATLAIENCLLVPLQRIFTSQAVNDMDDEQISELAAEPPHIRQERERLSSELEKLQAGMQAFNVFTTDGSSLPPPPSFATRATTPVKPQSPSPVRVDGTERKIKTPKKPSASLSSSARNAMHSPQPSIDRHPSPLNSETRRVTHQSDNLLPGFGNPTQFLRLTTSSLRLTMTWPYHIVSVSSEQKHERRVLLDQYGSYAQLSALIPILGYQFYLLGQWAYRRTARSRVGYSAVSQPSRHHSHHSSLSTTLQRWSTAQWWLNDEIATGWGLRQHWIAGVVWGVWMLFLCVHRTGDDYLHLTKRFGIVAAAQFPLHYMLSMKSRYAPLVFLLRSSHERLNPWHRLSGRIIYALLGLHAALYLNYYIQSDALHKLRSRAAITGLLAITLLTLLTATSLDRPRRTSYRLFFTLHLLAAIVLLPLLFIHVSHLRLYILETLLIFAFDRLTRRFLSTVTVPAHITRIPRTSLLHLRLPLPATTLATYRAAPGQHVYLSLPPGRTWTRRHLSNPFSVARVSDAGIELAVRARDGPMTRALAAFADESSPARICVEGPLGGARWFPDLALEFDRVLIVAGGVGGTFAVPVYSVLHGGAEVETKGAGWVRFVWAVKAVEEVAWADSEDGWLRDENVSVYVTGPGREGEAGVEMAEIGDSGIGERGRPDLRAIVDEVFAHGEGERVAVLFCGPEGMARDLRGYVGQYAGREIWWYEEQFGW
ncbi:hypothetical protein BJX96DRAFT_184398 [Aspergillus floccosus]